MAVGCWRNSGAARTAIAYTCVCRTQTGDQWEVLLSDIQKSEVESGWKLDDLYPGPGDPLIEADQGDAFPPKYVELLASGGRDRPEKLLEVVGLNPLEQGFWERGFEVLAGLLAEFEEAAA